MPAGNQLHINLLGTSFTIKSDEDYTYLKRILWYLEKKVEETRQRVTVADPVKISILTSFYIIDELLKEKNKDGKSLPLDEEFKEIERITLKLIKDIDNIIDISE